MPLKPFAVALGNPVEDNGEADDGEVDPGATAAKVWPCSYVLARHVTRSPHLAAMLRGGTGGGSDGGGGGAAVLELGAGCGLPGLACWAAGAAVVRLTDLHENLPRLDAIVAANVAVFSLPNGVAFGDVCLNPYAVLHLNQLERLVTSAFVHADIYHLLSNMTGVLEDGSYLEARDGTAGFIGRLVTLLGLSQCTLVGMSW